MRAGLSHLDSCEDGDPHPNPPHKGEGTLPRAFASSLAPKGWQFAEVSANGSLPPLVGRG
ncbi:hypothetical protein MESS2_1050029 [Mesorhizobium metallidurans STM 2683]|uniref:Uncharacterized protein n=1 Tax=Mesorhizobium metallidurans STM 2683 TaxID=1297569 RepID=M5EGR1_9HYPH|nr:hypothetical protein MESS2_1050029 [Mesorhizobium metallidurans STM 2683]